MPWLCTQIGAREHYAIPRALHRRGRLARLITDWWAGPLLRRVARSVGGLRNVAARNHPEIPTSAVSALNRRFFLDKLRHRTAAKTKTDQFLEHLRVGQLFATGVNRLLHAHWPHGVPSGTVYFGYDTGCLETLALLRTQGIPTVVDQIDPARVEEEMVAAESERWPGWENSPGRIPDDYFARLAEEWQLADRVIVNSVWSRDALIQQGVAAEKIVIVPLAYEANADSVATSVRMPRAGPLTVLWLGTVNLRKGIQYLIEAAKLLRTEPVRFVVYGGWAISPKARATAPANVEFRGPVGRAQLTQAYQEGDVFILPTLSDGFAITQLEAMAHGLPVIATPNCGQVVTDGVDGRIVPARDGAALAAAIADLAADRAKVAALSRSALEKVKEFSLARLGERLAALEAELLAPQ